MRLTSVARLDLPPGPVHSYAVDAGAVGSSRTISFDQRRHVGAGQRPGSWMAVALRLPRGVLPTDLDRAWLAVVRRHGTLHTAFSRDAEGALTLHDIEVGAGHWKQHDPGEGHQPWEVVRTVLDVGCAPFARPSHRMVLAGADTDEPRVLLGLDHAHADAWSLLVLGRDLLACLADVRDGRAPGTGLAPVPSFAEHSELLEGAEPAPSDVQHRWAEILEAGGGAMPTFPLDLGDVSTPQPEVVEVRDVLDAGGLRRWQARAEAAGVRLLPLAVSVLTRVSRELSGEPLRAVLPVHSRYEQRWHDSVGWFITNAVLESTDPDPAGCSVAVTEAIRLGSYPLGPIMAPYAGMPTRPGMFALSWLDNRRLPVSLPPEVGAQHVSAVTRADGVMIWFVVDDGGLHLRCRYPETPRARASVTTWLDAVCSGLVASAAAAPATTQARIDST